MFGGNPQAIGIDQQQGSIDPSVMVPWATEMASNAATGGFAIPKQTGTLGVFGGKLAKTADQAALAKAEQMAAQGIPPETIWNETGWFQGKDGEWRFEISDDAAKVKRVYSGETRPLSDVISHPEVFAAYPEIADLALSAPLDLVCYMVMRWLHIINIRIY